MSALIDAHTGLKNYISRKVCSDKIASVDIKGVVDDNYGQGRITLYSRNKEYVNKLYLKIGVWTDKKAKGIETEIDILDDETDKDVGIEIIMRRN